jgi:hypothetical protein
MYSTSPASKTEEAIRHIAARLEDEYVESLGGDHEVTGSLYGACEDFRNVAATLGFDASNPYEVKPIADEVDEVDEVASDKGFDGVQCPYIMDSL